MARPNFQQLSVSTLLLTSLVFLSIAYYAYTQITVYLVRRRFKLENGCQPLAKHYPHKDFLFGIDGMRDVIRAGKEHRLLDRAITNYKRLGNTFGNKLFFQKVIMTCEPQNVKTVLSLKFKDYSLGLRRDTLGPLLGDGIFTSDGEAWSHSRAMIRPNFTRDQIADLEAFERHIQDLFKVLPRDGTTVDLQELFFRFTIDSATEFLFGKSVDTLRAMQVDGTSEATFAEAFNKAQNAISMRTRLGLLRYVIKDKPGQEAIRICHEYVDQFVDEAVRYRERIDLEKQSGISVEEKYVFLHELAKATKDKKRLRDELLNVLLAGRDTTASLLSNMWFVIAKRPDIFAKLRREVEETLHGDLPTYEQLRNMKYLKYCLNESLRLHPVVPGNSRLAIRDTVLPIGGGPKQNAPVFVQKGTIIVYNPYAMHRRKDFFGDDADEFKPERWELLRPGWEYLPFNGGPRICMFNCSHDIFGYSLMDTGLGQQYALTEAGYVTVRLLQEFSRVESRDPNPWMENLSLTVCSWNGTKVALTPAKE